MANLRDELMAVVDEKVLFDKLIQSSAMDTKMESFAMDYPYRDDQFYKEYHSYDDSIHLDSNDFAQFFANEGWNLRNATDDLHFAPADMDKIKESFWEWENNFNNRCLENHWWVDENYDWISDYDNLKEIEDQFWYELAEETKLSTPYIDKAKELFGDDLKRYILNYRPYDPQISDLMKQSYTNNDMYLEIVTPYELNLDLGILNQISSEYSWELEPENAEARDLVNGLLNNQELIDDLQNSTLSWLMQSQGYSIPDLWDKDKQKESTFIGTLATAMSQGSLHQAVFTIPIGNNLTYAELKDSLVDNNAICIPKNSEILLHSSWLGLTRDNIILEKDWVIPREYIRPNREHGIYNHSPQYVCGCHWKTEILPADRSQMIEIKPFSLEKLKAMVEKECKREGLTLEEIQKELQAEKKEIKEDMVRNNNFLNR